MSTKRLRRLARWCLAILALAVLVTVGCSVWINTDPDGLSFGEGGAAATGGSGGFGGTAGSGGTSTGTGTGGTGGAYGQAQPRRLELDFDLHPIPFPAEDGQQMTLGVDVVWRDTAAHPTPFDLSVEVAGVAQPMLQIFSIRERVFARAGTHLEPIREGVTYRVEVIRTPTSVWAQLVEPVEETVIVESAVHHVESWGDGTVTLLNARERPRVTLGSVRAWRGRGTVER